jgi:NitT/TauT family transport system substrate-binding protein
MWGIPAIGGDPWPSIAPEEWGFSRTRLQPSPPSLMLPGDPADKRDLPLLPGGSPALKDKEAQIMESAHRDEWARIATRRTSRRVILGKAGAVLAGIGALGVWGCGGDSAPKLVATPTPLPPPETTAIRLGPGACDAPMMIAERYLQEEGFTNVQFVTAGGPPGLTGDRADLVVMFVPTLTSAVEAGAAIIGVGGLHTGCAEIWAPPNVATLKDARGRTVVVTAKTPENLPYSYIALGLKNAGVDPSEVNFVVQPDANLTQLFLEGKSDLLFLATTADVAFKSNPQNKGHVVLDQAMEKPWSEQNCCMLTTTTAWLKANPIATRRALRAIYRAADSLPKDRIDAAKVAAEKGLFGGPANIELVRGAANMVPYDWRDYDVSESMRFHAKLMSAVNLSKLTPEETITKSTDLRFAKELATELKR